MPAVRYRAHIATTKDAEWPDPALIGMTGQVVAAGTSNPLRISEDRDGLFPHPNGVLTVTGQVMIPGFWCQDGVTEAEWVSGEYRVPLDSLTGVREAAETAAETAAAAAVEAVGKRLAYTIEPVPGQAGLFQVRGGGA